MSQHAVLIQRDGESHSPRGAKPVEGPPPVFEEMPGRSEWMDWHGARIHYRRIGAGPPLILAHMIDVGASCIEWRRNTAFLAEGFDTYSVDFPGFGLSGAPDEAPRAAL